MERRFILAFGFLLVGALGFTLYLSSQNYFIEDPTLFTNYIPHKSSKNGALPAKTLRNEEYGFELQYAANFFKEGHEPQILVGDCNGSGFPQTCPDVSHIVKDNPGNFKNASIQKWSVNNTQFCLYQLSNVAAGTQYYYDYYATVRSKKCFVVELQSQSETCENYLPLEQGDAKRELDYKMCLSRREQRPNILQDIVSTFTFSK